MHPLITSATPILSFAISDRYRARLFGDIQAPGIVQYHSLLAIYGDKEDPIRFYGAEWNRMDPGTIEEPVFGIFADGGHSNLGTSRNWRDPHLFLLRAVELLCSDFRIDSSFLSEGEGWAISAIFKILNAAATKNEKPLLDAAYWEAIRRNDARIATYLKANLKS